MSNNIVPLQPVVIRDKRLRVSEKREYAVFEGGQQVTYNPFTTTAFSNSYISFNVTTPSPRIILDRKIYIKYQITLTFTPIANPGGIKILQQGVDAFRAFPLSTCMTSINLKLNGVGVSISPDEIIQALMRYNTCNDVINLDYSMCPSMLDKTQNYIDLNNSHRNPLNFYGDNPADQNRGGFVIKSISNNAASATIVAVITEPLFISPLNFGAGNSQGFMGVQTFDLSITLSNLARMWSHMAGVNGVVFDDNSVVAQLADPTLLFCYITPKEIFPIPAVVPYSYYPLVNIETNQGLSIVPNATANLIMANTQLASVPRRIFIYASRPKTGTGAKSLNTTDTFFSIENISITWDNVNSILASATKQDLYQISRKNGCNLSWEEWSGEPSPRLGTNPIGLPDTTINLTGSVLCLDMGEDIGLSSLLAPGVGGNYNFQVYCTVKNINPTDTINPVLHVVIVSEGSFTVYNNTATPSNTVLSKEDVLNVSQMPEVGLPPIDMFYGGGFWSKFKDIGEDILKGVQKSLPVIRDAVQIGSEVAPYLAPLMGLGGGVVGGSVVGGCGNTQANPLMGGKMLTRNEMLRRLRQ